jgi:hypothetical protein
MFIGGFIYLHFLIFFFFFFFFFFFWRKFLKQTKSICRLWSSKSWFTIKNFFVLFYEIFFSFFLFGIWCFNFALNEWMDKWCNIYFFYENFNLTCGLNMITRRKKERTTRKKNSREKIRLNTCKKNYFLLRR